MRKWKRVDTAEGPRFRSALDAHEAALLHNLVDVDDRHARRTRIILAHRRTRGDHRHEDRQLRAARRRDDAAAAARFLPSRRRRPGRSARDSLNGALRSLHEPAIIDAKREAAQRLLDTLPDGGGKFELTEDDAHAWAAAVNDVRLALGTMLEISPTAPIGCRRPSAGRASRRLSVADRAAGVPGRWR